MAANRLCEPESKLGVWGRWLGNVYLPSCNGFFFNDKISQVEDAIFNNTANLFNLNISLAFYDTTTQV